MLELTRRKLLSWLSGSAFVAGVYASAGIDLSAKEKPITNREPMDYGYGIPVDKLDLSTVAETMRNMKKCPYFNRDTMIDSILIWEYDIGIQPHLDDYQKRQAFEKFRSSIKPDTKQICFMVNENGHVELHY